MTIEEAIKRVNNRGWLVAEIGEYERGRVPADIRWYASVHPAHLGACSRRMVTVYGNGPTPLAAVAATLNGIDNSQYDEAFHCLLAACVESLNVRAA